MKKIFVCLMMIVLSVTFFTACGNTSNTSPNTPDGPSTEIQGDNNGNEKSDMTRIKITFGNSKVYANFYDNATTRALFEQFPLELDMMDLYGREMCYRFAEALPTDNAKTRGYEVGEIVYYPPMHSFVIMYEQNGEHFQMQSLGMIDGSVNIFKTIGDIKMRFEIVQSEEVEMNRLKISANGGEFVATLVDNSSTKALKELIEQRGGSITINMSDYGNFEKVGSLGTTLPTNNEQISTSAGDLILYQGDSLVIYYDHNNWNFTRLGKIEGATRESLLAVLGNGNVTVILSLTE
ncbi:MAG: cyclophilin-like fold protein [Anaeroplasma bactoclasticum]|nr:cyclophilin-like fold protein [Anaeroplasma bactoclasticum]MCM1557571.1 cyclophilin-like fold protein [Anaeroplasma bactoclasticum]